MHRFVEQQITSNMIRQIPFILLLFVHTPAIRAQITLQETTVDTHTVISGLDHPWEILWGPDNHLWVSERFGRISRINPVTGEQSILLDLSQTVEQTGESGMLGLALHPSFPTDNRVYVVYTYLQAGDIRERLVSYHYQNNSLADPDILIDNIDGNTTHDGSRLLFGADGKLYMTTGDAQNQPAAQDVGSLNGKVLRINANGSVPGDNPIAGNYTYSYGHRNAQGLTWGPGNRLVSSEHGPDSDDEINIIEAGRNYGWPDVRGFCDLPDEQTFCEDNNVKEPQRAWTPTIATSDIAYYTSGAIPEFQGSLLMVTLKEQDLRVLKLASDGETIEQEEIYFNGLWGRLRAICVAPDGSIYLSNSRSNWSGSVSFDHQIIRIFNPEAQGLTEPSAGNRLRIYPTPFDGELHIIKNPALEADVFVVRNAQGLKLATGSKEEVTSYLCHKNTPAGIYYVEVHAPRLEQRQAVVKVNH